jgi:PqqD family protein of HPr-rel-A system
MVILITSAASKLCLNVSDNAWICSRRSELAISEWEDGTVVFDDANGYLQCLNPVSGSVLALLIQSPQWTSEALAQELLGEAPTADDVTMVENSLAEFSSLNLIERVVA